MNNEYLSQISELEQEFTKELRGYGSLTVNLSGASDDQEYLGYDIRPEDIEALYFEGIGVPRWETIKADSVDRQIERYNESMQKVMADYPLIGRANDTDKKVEYTPAEVSSLREECDRVLETATDPKAVHSLRKVAVACHRAGDDQKGLVLIPN